jgi:hypothetical protein
MSETIAALIGVIAGALTTGGTQAFAAHLDRGRTARVAARLLWEDQFTAVQAIDRALAEAR